MTDGIVLGFALNMHRAEHDGMIEVKDQLRITQQLELFASCKITMR